MAERAHYPYGQGRTEDRRPGRLILGPTAASASDGNGSERRWQPCRFDREHSTCTCGAWTNEDDADAQGLAGFNPFAGMQGLDNLNDPNAVSDGLEGETEAHARWRT
jgi:hypothetical protein